jgi:RNA recognition motif-containing protein
MRIFVGNLASTTTEEALKQLFEVYGDVTLVRIVASRQTGRSLGYGYVEMPNATEAHAAIEGLQGTTLEGWLLTMTEAYEREGKERRLRW